MVTQSEKEKRDWRAAFGVAFIVLVCAAYIVFARIKTQDLDRIQDLGRVQPGMTASEVERIAGKPTSVSIDDQGGINEVQVWRYRPETPGVTTFHDIIFKDGEVAKIDRF